jgi:hypothetical protein
VHCLLRLLQIAIKESNVSSHPSNIPIAKAALKQLLALVQARRDEEGSAEPGSDDSFALTEADVLKTMVKVHQQVSWQELRERTAHLRRAIRVLQVARYCGACVRAAWRSLACTLLVSSSKWNADCCCKKSCAH